MSQPPDSTPLKYITVAAATTHTATVIFLHGLGGTGHDWWHVANKFTTDSDLQHVKWILPHSPVIPITANGGRASPSWYDIFNFADLDKDKDEVGIFKASRLINDIITAEIEKEGIDSERIILGGFSQGAALSLITGLTNEKKLGGVVALSGRLILKEKIKDMLSQHANSIPIFVASGTEDHLVDIGGFNRSVEYLKIACGIPTAKDDSPVGINCNVYEGMGHSTSYEELEDLKAWIKTAVPRAS